MPIRSTQPYLAENVLERKEVAGFVLEEVFDSARSTGQETGYGYGCYVDRREGRESDGSVWHGGVQQGFTSDLWILPSKHIAVVILTNLEGGGRLGLGKLANELADIVLH